MLPPDWPPPGPIDLALHDLPHRSSSTEWWYLNAHVEVGGRPLSLFAAFFRIKSGESAAGAPRHAHSVTWALSDPTRKTYLADSRLDPAAPKMGLERIAAGRGSRDPRLNRAISEMLVRGSVPAPDRLLTNDISVATDRLALDYSGLRFERNGDGSYLLALDNPRTRTGCELTFTSQKPPARHGDDGLVRGPSGEDMFYYFVPRCAVTGTVTQDGVARSVTSGSGWYDHEFGGWSGAGGGAGGGAAGAPTAPPGVIDDIAWNWLSAQLDDGSDVSAYSLVRCRDQKVLHQWTIVVEPGGAFKAHGGMAFEPSATWRSVRTFYDYPTRWSLAVPEAQLALSVAASFDDQELLTVLSKPAFWEGRVEVSGTLRGRPVRGLGFVERSGFEPIKDLDQFFGAVGEEVRKSVARTLPHAPTFEEARTLIAADDRPQYLDGVDLAQLSRSLFAPIREMTDRGGKSWRSYAALACCDVVGGDSRKYVQWLAMPELMHVGSLIVDDVQDKSAVRRGGPACHLIYGEPLAINAGTAAYFLTQRLLLQNDIPDGRKLRLYDLYFEAMRAGHAGQALDLDGLLREMPAVVEEGAGLSTALERRVLATHRLKTAAPAAALARMGAVVGGGTEAQIEAVGNFFEALGLAFQIVDDVLNLRGFKNDLKLRAEDIKNGVITLPVAKAMARLPLEGRRWLWQTLQAKTDDPRVLSAAVELLETCGAIAACATEARELVEVAWQKAEPLLEDSIPKVMLRAFGWYVLERHY